MQFTQKQERNGATGATSEQDTPVSGPDATAQIASAISSAMATDRYTPPAPREA